MAYQIIPIRASTSLLDIPVSLAEAGAQDMTMDSMNIFSEPVQFPHCHQFVSDTLCESLRFERVISELSTKFINLPADQIDHEIVRGLGEIVLYTRSASAILYEFAEGSPPRVAKTHKWALPEVSLFSDAEIFENLWWGLQ